MKEILLLGAGKIGETIASLLAASGDYRVSATDASDASLAQLKGLKNVTPQKLDTADGQALAAAMQGKFAVLSAIPYFLNAGVIRAAAKAGLHYLDLTEDVESTRLVKEMARGAKFAFIPQCGLAPGFISIAAADVIAHFDKLQDVHLRTGALPQFPSNALKYNLTWSTDGLINEYLQPCEAIVLGKRREVPALEELEHFSLDGIEYEAFNTSGGLGTLTDSLQGKVQNLNYRSIRYPGHRDLIKVLIRDLRLGERPALLKDIFEHALPRTRQDVVLIYVTVTGAKKGEFLQETFTRKIYSREINGVMRSGIQITTASAICAVLDLLAEGKIKGAGLVKQEEISFPAFIANRFGKNYAPGNGTDLGGKNP
ncbi:MAG TPA: saccharopine dehydrogenase family protein [Sphingomonadales bacterium]|nr:saccharopine dehydrogenase family protein [Sphingomonadales bacterium]